MSTILDRLKAELIKEIVLDEHEYCFDRTYCSDDHWVEQNGSETREQAFINSVTYFTNMSISKIVNHFGDKYEFVFDRLGLSFKDFADGMKFGNNFLGMFAFRYDDVSAYDISYWMNEMIDKYGKGFITVSHYDEEYSREVILAVKEVPNERDLRGYVKLKLSEES